MEGDGFFDRRLGPPILPLLSRGSDVITIAALTCDGPVSSICFFQNRTASRFYPSALVPTSIPNQRPTLGRSTKTQSATLDLTPWERTP